MVQRGIVSYDPELVQRYYREIARFKHRKRKRLERWKQHIDDSWWTRLLRKLGITTGKDLRT
jgi:hypothetical protein